MQKHGSGRILERLFVFSLLACISMAGGCSISIEAGRRIDLVALDSRLIAGQSVETDIAAALGPPFGQGRSMFPFHDKARDTWVYYYERGELSDDRRTLLWVFIDDGIYDGYIWFSSLPGLP